jgi:serine protease AprX
VLAAIGWVVRHRNDGDLDIRVLNLSFGTDGVQDYRFDPLAYAVEQAWRKGIVVVAAAGNDGYGSDQLNNPAYDPYVIAVGATDPSETARRSDDVVAPFSSVGTDRRRVDVVAPGTSILSLRTPGSFIDQRHASARAGTPARLFRGSGTSQAAAVVSGAVALLLSQRPGLGPDEVKALLVRSAYELPGGGKAQGAGLVDLARAGRMATPDDARQRHRWSDGSGTLQAARGTLLLAREGDLLRGERNIFGHTLDLVEWVLALLLGRDWRGGAWMGELLTGSCWCEDSWAGPAWEGRSWTDADWSGRSWTSDAWKGRSWTSSGWTGDAWKGRSWTSDTWAGDTWSSSGWR